LVVDDYGANAQRKFPPYMDGSPHKRQTVGATAARNHHSVTSV
jgi:hypothetical protein